MMARVAYLLTVQEWNEMRLFFRQAPILAAAGHDVTLMCVSPDERHPLPERMRLVDVGKAATRKARRNGSLNLRHVIQEANPDILVITCMEQLPLGLWIKKRTGIRVIYDCREDHPSAVRYHKAAIPRWLRFPVSKLIAILEYLGDRWFDGLIVSDPAIGQMHCRMPKQRMTLFMNLPQRSLFAGNYLPLAQRPYDLAMLGSMSVRVGVDYLVEAMGRLNVERGKRLTLLVIGKPLSEDRQLAEAVESHCRTYGMQGQIVETGYLAHDKVPEVLAQAKIGLSPHRDMLKFRRNIACKCFEYMACGMPVVCSDLPPQRLFIRDGENGRFYTPGDVDGLMAILDELTEDVSEADRLGRQGRRDFEERWNCERDAGELVSLFDRVLEYGRPR